MTKRRDRKTELTQTPIMNLGEQADAQRALRLYMRLDNDRRAGCEISDLDWAECYQAAQAALARFPQTEGGA